MKLIFKEKSYDEARISTNLLMLKNRKEQLCKSLFGKMQNPEHKFHCLLSETSSYTHGLHHKHTYQVPKVRTERCKSSVLYHGLFNYQ